MTLYYYTLNLHYLSVKLKIIASHSLTNKKLKSNNPIKNMNIYLFEQVVYIPPNSLKMKNKRDNFASFSGRSV